MMQLDSLTTETSPKKEKNMEIAPLPHPFESYAWTDIHRRKKRIQINCITYFFESPLITPHE